jgi:hypothetical protein
MDKNFNFARDVIFLQQTISKRQWLVNLLRTPWRRYLCKTEPGVSAKPRLPDETPETHMKKLTYPIFVIALASMLVAPPSAFAQQDRAPAAPTPLRSQNQKTPASPPRSDKSRAFYYYRPGNLTGSPYQTMKECAQAAQQAGNVGVCVMK